MIPIYTIHITVPGRDCDFQEKLKLSTLFGYFQDIAGLHASDLGAGIGLLDKKFGVAWILMRFRADILRMPAQYEEITIETWPQEPAPLHERDYLIRDAHGEIIVRGASVWIVMNIAKREIVKEMLFKYDVDIYKERAIDAKLTKIKSDPELLPILSKKIEYSDLDRNHHINNARYMDYVMDCIGAAVLETQPVKQVEINYINEVRLGETLTVSLGKSAAEAGAYYFEGSVAEDGRTSFRTKIVLGEKKL